jgi:hypothetical protein
MKEDLIEELKIDRICNNDGEYTIINGTHNLIKILVILASKINEIVKVINK